MPNLSPGFCAALLLVSAAGAGAAPVRGLDASLPAVEARAALARESGGMPTVPWLRLREHGLTFLIGSGADWQVSDPGKRDAARAALAELRSTGARIISPIERNRQDWPSGMHVKDGARQVRDLREAAALMWALREAYGESIHVWEVENEPDLGFYSALPENYAAQLKAMYWGARGGDDPAAPRVVMGALGLPPGPWLERFAENDGFTYTDGFNFHYYGYADDFRDVYARHGEAVATLGRSPAALTRRRHLPVYVTEVGYGMLSPVAADAKEGRVRQWRWFREVGRQADQLRAEAVMGYVLRPYLAYGSMEFGLTVPEGASAPDYAPADFGAKRPDPWMSGIGARLAGHRMTPALAWWLGERTAWRPGAGGGEVSTGRTWPVAAGAPSPVVIDFLPGDDLMPLKRYGGHFVTGVARRPAAGEPERGPGLLPPMIRPSEPPKATRAEDFIVQVRSANGNLFEVYPVRPATREWQTYLEHRDNFTLSFYGRAKSPWRFRENQPQSLVLTFYPRHWPATFEFRHARLVRLGAADPARLSGSATLPRYRYGYGEIIVYNLSDRAVRGRLSVPRVLKAGSAEGFVDLMGNELTTVDLAPQERKVIPVAVGIPGETFQRADLAVTFEPDDPRVPPARFKTAFFPALEGMRQFTVARLAGAVGPSEATNSARMGRLRLAGEEAPRRRLENGWSVQEGAEVVATADGFEVVVTGAPPGKPQRVEVEFPWPGESGFPGDSFLLLEYRLRE